MVLQELGSFTVKEDRFLVSPHLRPAASDKHCSPAVALWCLHAVPSPVMPL